MPRFFFIISALAGAFVFLTPMELGDVWWHLATGKWIAAEGGLPASDPFSIAPGGANTYFVVTSFWLAQILLYALYLTGGLWALVIAKALLFSATSLVIFRLLTVEYRLPHWLGLLLLVPLWVVGVSYDELRPQTLSFLFFALTFLLLERRSRNPEHRPFFLLPLLTLLWSNMHGGVVSGVIIICFYLAGAIARRYLKAAKKDAPALDRGFLAGGVLSVLISGLNPNGYHWLKLTWGMLRSSAGGSARIHEHLSTASFARFVGEESLEAGLLVLGITATVSFVPLLWKGRFGIQGILRLLLFSALALGAYITFRAGFFFSMVAVATIGANLAESGRLKEWLRPERKTVHAAVAAAALLALVLAGSLLLHPRSVLANNIINPGVIPTKIASRILEQKPPENIYHPYEWGGYFIWRLWPEYRVFIDGRAVGLMDEYLRVREAEPGWRDILEKREVNTVVYWPLLPYEKRVPEIVFALMSEPGWAPVYWDLQSLMFVREDLAEKTISKGAVWELLGMLISQNIKSAPGDARLYVALGRVYLEQGRKRDAGALFSRALELDPGNRAATLWLSTLGAI